MSLCVRFVDKTTSTVREEFLGFSSTTSTTGEVLANAFSDILTKLGVRPKNMRGQGYDGASNMSGIHRGVQARIRQLIPEAVYTHCKAHCLNLAIIHASKERYAKNMMDTVQQVAFAFNYSAKRLLLFQETLADDNISKEAMAEGTKLRSLCETRWSARADAFHTFLASYRTVVTALDQLSAEHGDTKAGMYKMAVLTFDFIVTRGSRACSTGHCAAFKRSSGGKVRSCYGCD
ncbi:zinc finger MYM-type protein 1-like [Dreissena polymorpha]|uniref:zinc finger MYM-type protein 1-like n=1 Tax=Dreissena polymorpha TaxID=45954 RepID=UPI002264279E|nr:zinc finger MYM-type protein 1-like [Dreissena polymorpha]